MFTIERVREFKVFYYMFQCHLVLRCHVTEAKGSLSLINYASERKVPMLSHLSSGLNVSYMVCSLTTLTHRASLHTLFLNRLKRIIDCNPNIIFIFLVLSYTYFDDVIFK